MQVIHSASDMQRHADERRAAGRRLALVPTMGALHDGHLALVRRAKREGDEVVVTIFVNPTQFGPTEDFGRYPRMLEQDLARLEEANSEITVFAPSVEEMYPGGANLTWVVVDRLDEHLCGRHRPGHFRGVTTVVARLFNICKPHVAVFGLKDAQQFVILKRMVTDLHFDVEMVGEATVREPDGLAYSSRNAFLTPDERAQAPAIARAIETGRDALASGERSVPAIVTSMRDVLRQVASARVQYLEVVREDDLRPVEEIPPGAKMLVAAAVYFGDTRLIDSAFVQSPPETSS